MISSQVVIMTREELGHMQQEWYSRGVARGKYEAAVEFAKVTPPAPVIIHMEKKP